MAHVLYENGKKVGEVTDWIQTERLPQTKLVLGKSIITQKLNDQCTFTSPKVVSRKSELTIITDKVLKLSLGDVKVKDGTYVTATIALQTKA